MFFGMLITGGLKLLHIFPPYIWMLILLVGIFYSVKFLIKKSQKTFLLKLTIILGMIICLWAVDYYSFNILSAYLGVLVIYLWVHYLLYITCIFLVDYQSKVQKQKLVSKCDLIKELLWYIFIIVFLVGLFSDKYFVFMKLR